MAHIPTADELGPDAPLEQIKGAAYDHARAIANIRTSAGDGKLDDKQTRAVAAHEREVQALTALAEDREPDPAFLAKVGAGWMDSPTARALNGNPGQVHRDQVALAPDQTFEAWGRAHGVNPDPEVSMTGLLRGLAWGMWDEPTQRAIRNQGGATGSEGGFLVPDGLSFSVLDRARNQMRVVQAGAMSVPMPTPEYSIAKVASDPSTGWRKESATITETEATFEKLTLSAKTLSALVKIPLELIEDTRDGGARSADPLIRNLLAEAIALEFDRVALLGDGDESEPVGLLNTSGVSTNSMAAAPTSWDFVVDRAGVVEDNNFAVSGAITSPRVGRQLGKLKDTTNQPLRRPERVDYPILETNQVPTTLGGGSDESLLFAGQFDQLLLGVRTRLQLIPLRERFMDTGEIGLIAWFRGDVGVARTGAFAIEDQIQA